MQIGIVGLGRMGMNMARRLMAAGIEVAAYNRSPKKTEELGAEGATVALGLEDLAALLERPRAVWVMLPAGPAVDEHVEALMDILDSGDTIIDGGNSYFKDDLRRADILSGCGFNYLDAGISGGVHGLAEGYCTMVGGSKREFLRLEPIFKALAPEGGYMHCGPVGAGHFVKMVHNGIEYGMMQAYAEGFNLLAASEYGPDLDFADLSRLWNRGSVIRSWLLELAESAFAKDPRLEGLEPRVDDSGEGRWTVEQAVDLAVFAPVMALSLMGRFRSRDTNSFADRMLAALRREFGGHAVHPKNPETN